jgi:hypothetical protein
MMLVASKGEGDLGAKGQTPEPKGTPTKAPTRTKGTHIVLLV